MDIKTNSLFSGGVGARIYSDATAVIHSLGLDKFIRSGVLVGLSGGADSVMLLCFLKEYGKRNGDFPILAVHINHMIRGSEADSDEKFSRNLCQELGVDFESYKIDVPHLTTTSGKSLEEAARDARYSKFSEIIQSRNDISTIAVAHNADDNLETVLLNIFRGAGTRGAAGIPVVRDNIFRPLIRTKKSDIISALRACDIPFVTDSTNMGTEYKRNKIRHLVIPSLYGICDDPVAMATRFSMNLRNDDDFINEAAEDFLSLHRDVSREALLSLHRAVLARVIIKMAKSNGVDVSAVVVDSVIALLQKDNFSYSLSGGARFVCERGKCFVLAESDDKYNYRFELSNGKNVLEGYDSDFFVSSDKIQQSSLNVYKISIQADLSSAIIIGSLYIRPRTDGDTIYYGGITRKLKKLFTDAKIPQSLKKSIPILCDDRGVVWVPGFGVRDDGGDNGSGPYVALAIGKEDACSDIRMHSASEYR